MKYYTTFPVSEDFYLKADLTVNSPNSGFIFSIGNLSSDLEFTTGISISGTGGMLFDQSGRFFGGYYSGRQFNIECHFFTGSSNLFHNGVIMANDFPISEICNAIELDKYEDSSVSANINYGVPYPTISEESLMYNGQLLFFNGESIVYY
jgi:hypothetical protein